jgi:dihydroorotate dehydrogenase (NAD+) catalytic subunit
MAKKKQINLSVNLGKLKLKNPVMTASGTFGYGEEYSEFIDINKLGAIVISYIKNSLFLNNSRHRS